MSRKSKARLERDRNKSFISDAHMRAKTWEIFRGMWPAVSDKDILARVKGMAQEERDALADQVMAQVVAERIAS